MEKFMKKKLFSLRDDCFIMEQFCSYCVQFFMYVGLNKCIEKMSGQSCFFVYIIVEKYTSLIK